jgi:TPR repeat protein
MYEGGIGTRADPESAARWYLAAARAGNVHAQHHLAEMYRDGRGVARDLAAAAGWTRRAAEAGHTEVFADLAQVYWSGAGVAPDPVEAYVWWRLAADAGDPRGVDGAARAEQALDEAQRTHAGRRLRGHTAARR